MSKSDILTRLYATIESRKGADPKSSYTAKLFSKGVEKSAQKLGEEAVETAIAAVAQTREDVIEESADLLYHLLVLWAMKEIKPDDVFDVLAAREGLSGIDEKNSRKG